MHFPFAASSSGAPNNAPQGEQPPVLREPVRIRFDAEWKAGNPLFDWYSEHSNRTITRIQKRKERCSPSFHEYIVIQLDNGECYRFDRRPAQRPGSLTFASSEAVAVSDTIEYTPSLSDSLHCPEGSDLDPRGDFAFNVTVQLQLILHIIYAIHSHPKAKVYTLHFYNCYFFAQAIMYCILRSVGQKHNKDISGIPFPFSDDYWKRVMHDPDIVDPASVDFPPIDEVGGAIVLQSETLRQLSKKAVVQGKKLVNRLLGDKESDRGSVWDLNQSGQELTVLDTQGRDLPRALRRGWEYGARLNKFRLLLKGSSHSALN